MHLQEGSQFMAMINQVRDAMHRQPFRPFTLYLVDGRLTRGVIDDR
jgi:hypothetical protein